MPYYTAFLFHGNEEISKPNIENSECFGVKFAKIYPEMTSQFNFFLNMVLVDYIGILYFGETYYHNCMCYNHEP
jgi:hypothetical protein